MLLAQRATLLFKVPVTESYGSKVEITGTSDGEAVTFNMRDRSPFSELNSDDNNSGGTFALGDGTTDRGDKPQRYKSIPVTMVLTQQLVTQIHSP